MALSLRVKIILVIFVTTTLSAFVFLGFQNRINTKLLSEHLENEILTAVELSINDVNRYTHMMEQKVSDLALAGEFFYEARKVSPEKNVDAEVERYLVDSFSSFPEAIGGGLWYEPGKIYPEKKHYGPYAFRENGKVVFTWDLSTPKYDYHTQEWYTTALPNGWDRTVSRERVYYWTPPYYDDAGTFMLMITVDAFMYDKNREIVGISTADWSIEDMLAFLKKTKVTPDSGVFLVDTNSQTILTNTLEEDSAMKSVTSVPWMSAFVGPQNKVVKKTTTVVGTTTYSGYYGLTDSGMLYGMLVPTHVLSHSLMQLSKSNMVGFIIFDLFLIFVLYLSLLGVTNPVITLTKMVTRIAGGDLAVRVPVKSHDELGRLGEGFNKMVETLSYQKEEIKKRETSLVSSIAELKSLKDHLEERVAEKTAALSVQIKETEQHAEELKKFQLAVENTSQHVVITDAEGNILYANDAVTITTGYSKEEIVGKTPALWGGQMPKTFYEEMWQTIKMEKRSFSGEVQNKRKNGEPYSASIIVSPILSSAGEVKFFVGIESDISKQKAFEQALSDEKARVDRMVVERTKELKEERARLLASINSLSFGFIIADTDNRVILRNKAMDELFGFRSDETTSIDDISGLLGEHFNLHAQVTRCLKDRSTCVIKEIAFGKKFLRGIIAPVFASDGGGNIGYVFLLEDVTEAYALERGRDAFFAIASHELRTPLTAIRGNMSMIEEYYQGAITDNEVMEMVRDANSAATRLITIVNDFLDVSRLEQGSIAFRYSEFRADEMIAEVVGNLADVAAAKGVRLYVEHNEDRPMIRADRDRAKQVLTNLIANAINYSGRGTVTVGVSRVDTFAEFFVRDEGDGISEQNQTLLFRKFQQAGDSELTRDKTQSTGLGLYISRLIVEPMGGKIWLKSSVLGEGSVFAFTLPLA